MTEHTAEALSGLKYRRFAAEVAIPGQTAASCRPAEMGMLVFNSITAAGAVPYSWMIHQRFDTVDTPDFAARDFIGNVLRNVIQG